MNSLVSIAGDIVVAYVAHNPVKATEIAPLIQNVHGALLALASPQEPEPEPVGMLGPAVSIRRSVTPDHIVCLEGGLHFTSLRRHLKTRHNLTPDEYRRKWGLPESYPMVAPAYAAKRSELAKQIGLGRKGTGKKPGTRAGRRGSKV